MPPPAQLQPKIAAALAQLTGHGRKDVEDPEAAGAFVESLPALPGIPSRVRAVVRRVGAFPGVFEEHQLAAVDGGGPTGPFVAEAAQAMADFLDLPVPPAEPPGQAMASKKE